MYRFQMVLLLTASLVVTGCGAAGAEGESAAAAPQATAQPSRCRQPRRVVVGIDFSGSYQLAREGLDQVATLVEHAACPGDEWFLRAIEENSYYPPAALRTVRFPALPLRPSERPELHLRRQYLRDLQQWQVRAKAFATARAQQAQDIRALNAAPARATDIYGFLAKAGELLVNTPQGTVPVVVMATDLVDTAGRDSAFDLQGAVVLVLAFEAEDPTVSVRDFWQDRLRRANASTVHFRDVTERSFDVLDALALGVSP